MGYGRYVGRVGALALALGVGVAVATPAGSAWADEADGSSANNGAQSQQSADASQATDPRPTVDSADGKTGLEPSEANSWHDDVGDTTASTIELGDGVVVSSSGGFTEPSGEDAELSEEASDQPQSSPEPEETWEPTQGGREHDDPAGVQGVDHPQSHVGALDAEIAVGDAAQPVAVLEPTPEISAEPVAQIELSATAAVPAYAPTSAAVVETNAAQTNLVTGVLATMLSPFASTDPNAPVDSPVLWVLAAAARRQFGAESQTDEASTFGVTGEVETSLLMSALVVEDDAVLGTPDPTTGAVSGVVVPPPGPDNRKPSYTLVAPPAEGTLTFNRSTGAFTYTPTAAQRVLAGLTPDEATVDFTVNVKYGWNGTPTAVTVTVPVSPTPIADVGDVATGDGALGIAVTNTRAYVTNTDAGTVSVIDTINRVKITDIVVGDLPQGAAVTPDGKKLYVASGGTNTISVIDTATNTVISTINLGDRSPQLMAISPNGRTLYVTTTVYDSADDTVVLSSAITKISTSTNKITGAVRNVGLVPYQITVSPDGRKVYVISEVESDDDYRTGVFVFSSSSNSARQITGVGDDVEALAVSPDSKRLYVGDWETGTISVVDTRTYRVLGSFTTAPETVDELAVNRDGTLLMVMNAATHAVDVYETATGQFNLLQSVPTNATTDLNFPEAVLSPDGMELYFTSDGALQIISLVPPNTHPERFGEVVGDPAANGVVTGEVGVVDADGDILKYSVTGAPGKGKVVINPDGTFTYTPTAAARHAASASNADPSALVDTFAVTIDDGRRGIVSEEITVSILPANVDPTYKVSSPSPSYSTGVVKGSVTGRDADRDALTYTASSTSDKGGSVTIDARGRFTYTPTAEARHAAAAADATAADKVDSFTVTIDDGHGATVDVAVTVKIRPANARPDNAAVTLGPPAGDGAVVGTVTATDADNDSFTLSGPASTRKGAITYDNSTGTFTYTPTVAAREAATNPRASTSTKTDTFTVTVNDGHGGTDTVRVRVTIAPISPNQAPINGSYNVDPPAADGTVTGAATATDPDGDQLTFSGPMVSAKGGTVDVHADGTFTYTPTAEARQAAGEPEATPADKQDTFTVTAADAFGGTLAIQVTVPIKPDNSAPGDVVKVVGQPDSSTGVVTGSVTATDPDGDTLTYELSAPPSSILGSVSLDPDTGEFTFTPTLQALLSAWAYADEDPAATFVVTVTDGRLTTNVEVSVPVGVPTESLVAQLERLGSRPSAVAVDGEGRIYVTDSGANTLTIVNPTDLSKYTVQVGRSPQSVVVDQFGRVLVANAGDDTVTVLDRWGNTQRTIVVGRGPTNIAVGSDGAAYVTNTADNTVTVIDPSGTGVRTTIAVELNPTGITAGADGYMYVAHFGGTVSIIDPANGYTVDTLRLDDANPYGIAAGVDGTIYVTDPLNSKVIRLTPAEVADPQAAVTDSGARGYTVAALTVEDTPSAITVAADGTIYVTNSSGGSITAIDPQFTSTTAITVGANPTGVFVDSDGRILVTDGSADGLTIVDPQVSSTTSIAVGADPVTITIGYNGELVIVDNHDGAVTVIPKTATSGLGYAVSSTWLGSSVSGSAIATDANGNVYIATAGFFSSSVTTYAPDGTYIGNAGSFSNFIGSVDDLAIAPNGNTFAVLSNGLWVYTPNTGENTLLLCGRNCYGGTWNGGDAVFGEMGLGPDGMLYAPVASYSLYNAETDTTERFTNRLLVIDPNINSIVKSIQLSSPTDYYTQIAFGPNGQVVTLTGVTVEVVNPVTGATAVFNVGREAADIAFDSNGRAYLTNYNEKSVTVLGSDFTIEAYIPVGLQVGKVVTGADGKIYVGTSGTSVLIIDPSDYSLSSATLFGYEGRPGYTHDIAVGEGGVYVLAGSNFVFGGGASPLTVNRITERTAAPPDPDPDPPVEPPPGSFYGEYGDGPSSVAGLWNVLRDKTENTHNGVYIQTVKEQIQDENGDWHPDPNGAARLIVYIGGTTSDWIGPNQAILSNIPSSMGLLKWDQVDMINEAISLCTADTRCGEIEEILLVGFSQGGIDAQNLAVYAPLLGWDGLITGVVTYGSPILRPSPPGVATIHLNDMFDPIPKLDLGLLDGMAEDNAQRFYVYSGAPFPNVFTLPIPGINWIFDYHGGRQVYQNVAQQFMNNSDGKYYKSKSRIVRFIGEVIREDYIPKAT